jgi:hypothetical protein
MYFSKTSLLLFLDVFLTIHLFGCKKDRESCGGTLTDDPNYSENRATCRFDGMQATIPVTYSYFLYEGSLPDDTSFCSARAGWMSIDSSLSLSIMLIDKYSNIPDSVNTLYYLVRTGNIPYRGVPDEPTERAVAMLARCNGLNYLSLSDHSSDLFEIKKRSLFVENGDSSAIIEGIFCSRLHRLGASDSLLEVQGNFNTKIPLKR